MKRRMLALFIAVTMAVQSMPIQSLANTISASDEEDVLEEESLVEDTEDEIAEDFAEESEGSPFIEIVEDQNAVEDEISFEGFETDNEEELLAVSDELDMAIDLEEVEEESADAFADEGDFEKITVTFDGNGGTFASNGESSRQESFGTSTLILSSYGWIFEEPVKDGEEFVGWALDRQGMQPFDFNTELTEDTTLFAVWGQKYSNEGTASPGFNYITMKNQRISYLEFTPETGSYYTFYYDIPFTYGSYDHVLYTYFTVGDEVIYYQGNGSNSNIFFEQYIEAGQTCRVGGYYTDIIEDIKPVSIFIQDSEKSGLAFVDVWYNDSSKQAAHIFNDDIYDISIDPGKYAKSEGYRFEWTIGHMENGEMSDTNYGDCYEASEDGLQIQVDGVNLSKKLNDDEQWVDVLVSVYDSDNENVEDLSLRFDVDAPRIECYTSASSDIEVLPNTSSSFNRTFLCDVYNALFPNGKLLSAEYTGATIEPLGENPDAIIVYENKEIDSWVIDVRAPGEARVTMQYEIAEADIHETLSFNVRTIGEKWDIDFETADNKVLPGQSSEISAKLNHLVYKNSGTVEDNDFDDSTIVYRWNALDDSDSYFTWSVDNEDSRKLKIAANRKITGGASAGFEVAAYQRNENEDLMELARKVYYVQMVGVNYEISPDIPGILELRPGQSMQITPELHEYDDSLHEVDISDNDEIYGLFRYHWSWDPDNVIITDSTGRELQPNGDDEGEDQAHGEAPFTITRIGNDDVYVTVFAEWIEPVGSVYLFAPRSFHLLPAQGELYFENLMFDDDGGYAAHIYNDKEYDLVLHEGDLTSSSNFQIKWTVGSNDDAVQACYHKIEREGVTGITVDGSALYKYLKDQEMDSIEVMAEVINSAGNVLEERRLRLRVRETIEEYWELPDDTWNALPGSGFSIDEEILCYVENENHPKGDEIPVNVIDVSIAPGSDDGVVGIYQVETEEGHARWFVDANKIGHAIVAITHETYTGGKAIYYVDANIGEEVWNFWIENQDKTDVAVPGQEITLLPRASLDTYDPETNTYSSGDTSSVRFEWELVHEDGVEAFTRVSGTSSAGQSLTLRANELGSEEDARVDRLILRAYRGDSSALLGEVGHVLTVVKGYYRLEPDGLVENIPLGKTLTIYPSYKWHSQDSKEGEDVENIIFEWDYDKAQLSITPVDDGAGFEIKRLTAKNGSFCLIAYTSTDYGMVEADRCYYWFDSVWEDVSFLELRDPENNCTQAFTDEAYELKIDEDGLKEQIGDLPYTVVWNVGYFYDEEENRDIYLKEEDGFAISDDKITINGAVLIQHLEEDTDGVSVEARILVDGVWIGSAWTWLWVLEPEVSYSLPAEPWNALPGWSNFISQELTCYVRNADYPNGMLFQNLEISDVSVEPKDEGTADDAVTVERKDDQKGWELYANAIGHAVVTLTYESYKGTEETAAFDVTVTGDMWDIEIIDPSEDEQMLPGEKRTFEAQVNHYVCDEEGQIEEGPLDVRYEWEIEEDVENIFLLPEDRDVASLELTAGTPETDEYSAALSLHVFAIIEGEEVEVGSASRILTVRNRRFTLTAAAAANGDYTVSINDDTAGTVTTSSVVLSEAVRPGDLITITAAPYSGYQLGRITVSQAGDSSSVAVTNNTFVMPEADVVITVSFTAISSGGGGGEVTPDPTPDPEPAHVHVYIASVTREATCTSVGRMTYTCECGDSYTEEIPMIPHMWDGGTVTREAACTEEGSIRYTCTVCGGIRTEASAALGHDWDEEYTITRYPTTTEEGTMHILCLRCGAVMSGSEVLIPKSEQEEEVKDTDTVIDVLADDIKNADSDKKEELIGSFIDALKELDNDELISTGTGEINVTVDENTPEDEQTKATDLGAISDLTDKIDMALAEQRLNDITIGATEGASADTPMGRIDVDMSGATALVADTIRNEHGQKEPDDEPGEDVYNAKVNISNVTADRNEINMDISVSVLDQDGNQIGETVGAGTNHTLPAPVLTSVMLPGFYCSMKLSVFHEDKQIAFSWILRNGAKVGIKFAVGGLSPFTIKAKTPEEDAKDAAQSAIGAAEKLNADASLDEIAAAQKLINDLTKEQKGLLDTETADQLGLAARKIAEVLADRIIAASGKLTTDAEIAAAEKLLQEISAEQLSLLSTEKLTALQDARESIEHAVEAQAEKATALAAAKETAEKTLEILRTTYAQAMKDASDENLAAVENALKSMRQALKDAGEAGADIAAYQKEVDEVQGYVDNWSSFINMLSRLPAVESIKESDRSVVEACAAAYERLDASLKETLKLKKSLIDAAQKALDTPTISFGNSKVQKALKQNGNRTKRITLKKGKKLSLKAVSSTGAKITYMSNKKKVAKVSTKGVIKAKKKGKCAIFVTCNKSKIKVLLKIR